MTQPNPPKPLGMTDFFALEAGEYLERLDTVLQPAEGAAPLADELVGLAQALRGNPLAPDPLQNILKTLQPLRGLAALNDLPPLPDLLEGIERAIGELDRARTAATSPPGGPDLFQAAATAIARAAREVAERGRPDPESAEFQAFAGLQVKF